MYTLYSMERSGNCYKVRMALAQLGIACRLVDVDVLKGDHRTPEFLARNRFGQVPLLETAPGRHLPEANAILWFLAEGTPLLPDEPAARAAVLQWMFFEQRSIEPNIGAAWFWLCLVRGGRELKRNSLEGWSEEGFQALAVIEHHLAGHEFFAGERYSIADSALYGFTHLAAESDFDLAGFPATRAWLHRVAAQPRHVGMAWRPADELISICPD